MAAYLRLLILFFLIGISLLSFGQESTEAQRLQQLHVGISAMINSGKADTIKQMGFEGKALAKKLNNRQELAYFNYMLGSIYTYESPPTFKKYLDTARIISEEIDFEVGKMLVYSGLANYSTNRGLLDSALFYERKTMAILESFPDSPQKFSQLINAHLGLGRTYRNQTDYLGAMEEFAIAYGMAIEQNNINIANFVKTNVASTNRMMGRLEESKVDFKQVLMYADSVGHSQLKTWSLLGLAKIYNLEEQYNLALDAYRKALSISKKQKNTSLREIYLSLGNMFTKIGETDSATYYYDQTEALVTEEVNPGYDLELKVSRAGVNIELGQYDVALGKLKEALTQSREMKLPGQETRILNGLSKVYALKKDYEESYQYYSAYKVLDDSIFDAKNLHSINSLQFQFDTELKNQKITDLEELATIQGAQIQRRNLLIGLSFIVFILLTLLVYFIYSRKSERAKNNEQMAKLRISNAQLNPHFLFNSLSAIQELVITNSEPMKTSSYLSKFSALTRRMLEYTERESISLEDELIFLRNYLDLQQLRFREKFSYVINMPDDLPTHSFLIPPLISQPFVENSLEHGFKKATAENQIIINISETEAGIQMIIEDNGVGIDSTLHVKNQAKSSKAFDLTRGRMKFWERKTGLQASIDVVDISRIIPGASGTRITLNLPTI